VNLRKGFEVSKLDFGGLTDGDVKNEAKRVLKIEARAVTDLAERIDDEFLRAVFLLKNCQGKIIISGIGKSGQVARKISSTFSSTGTPSVFLHPSESSHGDMGVISELDLVVAVSYGGESTELNHLVGYLARKGISLIGITGSPQSTLGKASDVLLNVRVEIEACPLNLAPTASTTATLAMGDALAMAVLKVKGFKESDFAELHPGGILGRKLLTRVRDLMHTKKAMPLVRGDTPIVEVLSLMTDGEVRGVAGVVNDKNELVGVITDGDVRRGLRKSRSPLSDSAKDIMSNHPKLIAADELAERALLMMDKMGIQFLFAFEESAPMKPVGVLRMHDLLSAKIR